MKIDPETEISKIIDDFLFFAESIKMLSIRVFRNLL